MTDKKTTQPKVEQAALGIQRLVPTQKRSRERYELILATAAGIIAEKGSESFKMSDIVERAGVPHGSLYQYFADKVAIIGTLAERSNLEGRTCVEAALANVSNQKELHSALLRITDGYYQMFVNEPLMKDIWHATQSDRKLQKLDSDDMNALARILANVIQRLKPGCDAHQVLVSSSLIMHLIAAAVRHAISIEPDDGEMTLDAFKRILPKNISSLLI
ncbi:MAG: TetR/AcrR family transcriptional regulator [Thiogranum sp.]